MSEIKLGTFEDLLGMADEHFRPMMTTLREMILKIDPDACERVHLGYRSATFGVGPKKNSEGYCYIMPQKAWVNLGFYQGAHLDDPDSLLEGTGKNLRHIKIHSAEEVNRPGIQPLIEAALVERKVALGR